MIDSAAQLILQSVGGMGAIEDVKIERGKGLVVGGIAQSISATKQGRIPAVPIATTIRGRKSQNSFVGMQAMSRPPQHVAPHLRHGRCQ